MTNLTGFGLSAAINGAIALVVLSLFLCTRKRAANRFVYAPRTLLPQFRQGRPEPPPLPDTWLSWVAVVWRVSRDDLIAYAGLDAYMFCRFCMLCVEMFAAMTVLGVAILVPVNYTGQNGGDGFDAISMSNVPESSNRVAAHVIVAYLFAAWTYFMLWRCWSEYTELRLAYMAQEALHNRSLTLLVQNIPSRARTDTAFLAIFRSFFPMPQSVAAAPLSPRSARTAADTHPGQDSVEPHFIHSAYIARDTGDMADHVADRDDALQGMEKAVAAYRDSPEERPTTATKLFCLKKRDALEYYEEQIHKNDALLAEGRHEALTAKCWSSGFITFDSVMAYQSALRVDATSVPFEWQCKPAPELRDVYWPALSFTAAKRVTGNILAMCLLAALVILWLIPVAFIQSIANVSSLPAKLSFLSFINDIPAAVLGIIDGFLPPLILTIFNIVLPMILAAITKLQGPESASRLQSGVLHKFAIFWILNYLIFSTVATSIFNQLEQILNDPSGIVTLLGQSIPATATFFITYLLFQTFSSYPMQLLNPGRLVVSWLKKRFTVKVARDVVKIEAAPAQDYGTAYPMLVFAFVIAVTFACIAPIILPFAVLYFLSAFLCAKYQYMYYFNTAFETGGQFWPAVHLCLMWALFVGQLVFTVLLGIKKTIAAAVISAPLIVAPYIWHRLVKKAFLRRCQLLPLDLAVHIDANREQRRLMRHAQVEPDMKTRGLTFLDEASNVRNFGYDTAQIRAMRQDDITLPHNTPSHRRVEEYHAAIIREQRDALDGKRPVAIAPAEPTDKDGADEADKGTSLAAADRMLGNGDGGMGSVEKGEYNDETAHPASLYRAAPLPLSTSRSSINMGQSGIIEYRSQHPLLDRVLTGSASLGPLLPPQDYIQPALLVLPQLPVPQTMPPVERHDSLADKPELYDELREAALLRHAGGPPKAAHKQASAVANSDDSLDGSDGSDQSLIQQPTTAQGSRTPSRQRAQPPLPLHAQQQQQRAQYEQAQAAATADGNGVATAQQQPDADDPQEIVVHR